MNLLTIDWETYWALDYMLDQMTTESYVRDTRFEEILIGLKWNDAPAFWIGPERFVHFAANEVDWSTTGVIMHHAHFDGFILSRHHKVQPALYIDTLSMARVIDGPKAGNSLGALAVRHGIGEKGFGLSWSKGKHLADFTAAEYKDYGAYCVQDVELTYKLAQKFIPQLPESELKLIDLVVRMFTDPVLVGDQQKLTDAVRDEQARKAGLLDRIGATAKAVGSNEQFADLLRGFGVEPETKTSPSTGEQIYAFAKTDPAMQALLEDEDEAVRFLAEARIGIKSNLVLSRAQRFLDCASRGPMPVYIKYGAAHTLRMGGGDKMNWQNLSGVNAKRPEMSVLNGSVQAPPGHQIVRVDSGQGEARITAWLANQTDLVDAFRQGRDVYSGHASTVYGRTVDRKNVAADHIPGQVGKVSILGMSYGMYWYKASMELLKGMLGAPPIQFTAADMETLQVDPSRFLNNPKNIKRVAEMPSRLELNDRLIHCAVTKAVCDRYRTKYQAIVAYWDLMEHVITAMIQGGEMVFGAHGLLRTGKECIHLPNGMKLNYRGISRSEDGSASYFDGRRRTHTYGGSITENVTQCLHRLIVCEQMLEISEVLKVVLMRHDDVVCVVPDEAAEAAKQFMIQVMSKTPVWAPGLPLVGEGKCGLTLLEVK